MNLIEFLEARLAEDEVAASSGSPWVVFGRAAAEVAAKRSLIDTQFAYAQKIDGEWGCCHDMAEIRAGECPSIGLNDADDMPILADLALIYSGHEDYREEWAL